MPKRSRLSRKGSKARSSRLSRNDLVMMDFGKLRDIVSKFFVARFDRQPDNDPSYFGEWMTRFRSGFPEHYMDSQSLAVFKRLYRIEA